jgi:phage-related minor tail protein
MRVHRRPVRGRRERALVPVGPAAPLVGSAAGGGVPAGARTRSGDALPGANVPRASGGGTLTDMSARDVVHTPDGSTSPDGTVRGTGAAGARGAWCHVRTTR